MELTYTFSQIENKNSVSTNTCKEGSVSRKGKENISSVVLAVTLENIDYGAGLPPRVPSSVHRVHLWYTQPGTRPERSRARAGEREGREGKKKKRWREMPPFGNFTNLLRQIVTTTRRMLLTYTPTETQGRIDIFPRNADRGRGGGNGRRVTGGGWRGGRGVPAFRRSNAHVPRSWENTRPRTRNHVDSGSERDRTGSGAGGRAGGRGATNDRARETEGDNKSGATEEQPVSHYPRCAIFCMSYLVDHEIIHHRPTMRGENKKNEDGIQCFPLDVTERKKERTSARRRTNGGAGGRWGRYARGQ